MVDDSDDVNVDDDDDDGVMISMVDRDEYDEDKKNKD